MWVFILVIAWAGGGTLLGFLSGWYGLMSRYPDRAERSLLALKYQSGCLGRARMPHMLHLGVCRSGLRVGIMILFGPFSRDFLVPWPSIALSHQDTRTTVLDFGSQRLKLSSEVAEQLARAAGPHWPAAEPLLEDTRAVGPRRWLKWLAWAKWWVLPAVLGAVAFVLLPLMNGPPGVLYPALFLLGLFLPAVVFGLAFLVERLRER